MQPLAPNPSRGSLKGPCSEMEAAVELGVSIAGLRSLIRSHIVESDEDLNNVAGASFHPSDLVILKFLSKLPHPTAPG